ncbi:MAG: KUP/HAK/KT family potassium transporter, partial [Candidatus Methanoperedens sp.]|nr:KUP/HAK/KT family potassium transporter [Candidatus Methanoperedens sp.]
GHVMGILSLIIWTLIIVVTVEYAWLAMSLGQKGEGGTIVLKELLIPMLRSGRHIAFVTLLSFIGISLLFGDGVITPAISILSAVEGSLLIPGFENTDKRMLVIIAAIIAIMLFVFQKKGTEKVAWTFGPLMFIWFLVLAVSGIISILHVPSVLKAILNYLGQGAFVIHDPGAKSVLFEMIFQQAQILYVPFLILSIIATIIASQAMISGMFSIVYQGITTRVLPMLKVSYTSSELRSQIYIDTVNWFLLLSVLFIMFIFRESHSLAAAYGLAVNGDMVLTGILMIWIYYLKKNRKKTIVSIFVTLIAVIFLISSLDKLLYGGYWSIILAIIPFCIITIYTSGQKRLSTALKPMNQNEFLEKYKELYKNMNKINGTALFFARDIQKIPPYIVNTMFINNIIFEDNVIISITRYDAPFGVGSSFRENPADGLRIFEIRLGYMEVVNVENILKTSGINEKVIFYGVEDIVTENVIWKTYSTIKKLTPAFVQFYELPAHKIHGVITRIEM